MINNDEKISDYEAMLPIGGLMSVHKSFIVALEKINLIEGNRIMIDTHEIPIGQTYKSRVSRLIGA